MWRWIRQLGLTALIVGGLGCQHPKAAVNTKTPPDPLLISKKPVEGRPTALSSATSTGRDPQPAATQQPSTGRPIPAGYRSPEDASIGKPRWLPDGQ
jgi:hypothetical protein